MLHHERHDGLQLQPDDGHVQDGDDRQRVHDDLHQRGQDVCRHDPGVLRLRHGVHEGRLRVLHDDGRHARLLLHVLIES